jgi:hypothetical protein
MIAPATMPVVFLAGSVLHFGLGDTEDGLLPDRVPPWLSIVTYGALPILLRIALHPAAVAPMLDSGTISGEQLPRLGAA